MLDGGNRKELARAMAISQVGLMMAVPAGVGLLIDYWLESSPWGVISGAVLGLVTGLIQLVRLSNASLEKPSDKQTHNMTSRVLLLIVAAAAFWVLAAIPAYIWGDMAAVHAGVAVLMCLVPAVLTLLWTGRTFRTDPQQATLAALGSSGVRMFVVLIAALLLYMRVPPFQGQDGFLFWVAGAYLFVLFVEIVLLVRSSGAAVERKSDDRGA